MDRLEEVFSKQIRRAVPLARYTAARVGGPAEMLLEVRTANEMDQAVTLLWQESLDYVLLGGGSNVLVSDAGIRGVVLLNRARKVRFDDTAQPPTVWAESGANLGLVARQAALRGLAGLEWAAGIPGTVGGAVYGNAGAHGSIAVHATGPPLRGCQPPTPGQRDLAGRPAWPPRPNSAPIQPRRLAAERCHQNAPCAPGSITPAPPYASSRLPARSSPAPRNIMRTLLPEQGDGLIHLIRSSHLQERFSRPTQHGAAV